MGLMPSQKQYFTKFDEKALVTKSMIRTYQLIVERAEIYERELKEQFDGIEQNRDQEESSKT